MSAGTNIWSQYRSEEEDALQHERIETKDESFSGLVARHSRLMFRVAYALLRNTHDAEDAVQETFLKLYRSETWHQMEDEKSFLAKTVWRIALDRLPKKDRQMTDVAELELASADRSPEESAASDDEQVLLRRLIDSLPEELRQALVLSALEEMTSREVSELLGVPEGTVRTRAMRARTELKRRFEAMKGGRR